MPIKRIWDSATRAQFWSKVSRDEHGCWIWLGARRAAGYGTFYVQPSSDHPGGKITHRLAWLDLVGPIEDGLQLDHLCRVRMCVNPAHLEPVTAAVNLARKSRAPVRPPDVVPLPMPPHVVRHRNRRPRDAFTSLCPRGHEYAVTGWVPNGPGIRTCAACRSERYARQRKGGQHGTELNCPRGHAYDETSIRTRPDGTRSRECLICQRDLARARYHSRKAALSS